MECLASPSSWDGDHSQWSGQYPGPRNVRAPWPVSAFSHCLYTFLNKGVSTLSWHHLSLRPLIGHCHSVQASHWLVVARLTPCLTSACQRDRPQSVTVFRHNLNEHLGPDSNLGNYWIGFISRTPSKNTKCSLLLSWFSGKADGDDGTICPALSVGCAMQVWSLEISVLILQLWLEPRACSHTLLDQRPHSLGISRAGECNLCPELL